MARSIKIDGDVAPLKKSILDLSKSINKDLVKSKIELFTPDTKKFLRTELNAQLDNMKKKVDAVKDSVKRQQDALKTVVAGSKEELRLKEKLLKTNQNLMNLEKDRQKIAEAEKTVQGPTFGGQFMKMSGLSTVLKGIKGMAGGSGGGIMSGMGGLLGGGLLAAGAYGGSRVMAARDTWTGGVQDRLKLMGRGVSDMEPTNTNAMTGAGLNALTLRQGRLRDMDVFGKEGATQNSVIQRAQFERNYGVEEGTMSGIGAQLRPNMGGKQANLTVMKLQASLIASGITDAIGPYLETAAQMLTDINEKGFTHDEAVTSLFNSMLKTGMGEGRIQKLATGADQGIRGSSGEANAFFQSVFNKAGIGGGMIGGAQAAMRMGGLFGTDLSKYKGAGATDIKTMQTMGIGGKDHMKAVAGATLGRLDKLFGTDEEIDKQLNSGQKKVRESGAGKRLSRLRYMMQAFGLKDEGQAMEVQGLLKKAQTASPQEQKKIMQKVKDIQESTPELDNLKTINKSTAGTYDILKNEKTTLEDAIGDATSGLFNETNKLLNSIDSAILAIAKFLTGYETPEERQAAVQKEQEDNKTRAQKTAQKALEGNMLMPGERESLKNLPFEEGMDFTKQIKEKADKEKDNGFFRNRQYENLYQDDSLKFFKRGIEGTERRKLREGAALGGNGVSTGMNEDLPTSPTEKPQYMTPANPTTNNKEHMDLLKQLVRHSEVTAKNSKERGTLKPSTSSTTGN